MRDMLTTVTGLASAGMRTGDAAPPISGFSHEFDLSTIGDDDGLGPAHITDPCPLGVRSACHRMLASLRRRDAVIKPAGYSCPPTGDLGAMLPPRDERGGKRESALR